MMSWLKHSFSKSRFVLSTATCFLAAAFWTRTLFYNDVFSYNSSRHLYELKSGANHLTFIFIPKWPGSGWTSSVFSREGSIDFTRVTTVQEAGHVRWTTGIATTGPILNWDPSSTSVCTFCDIVLVLGRASIGLTSTGTPIVGEAGLVSAYRSNNLQAQQLRLPYFYVVAVFSLPLAITLVPLLRRWLRRRQRNQTGTAPGYRYVTGFTSRVYDRRRKGDIPNI
jgi:hypothetical protein